MADRNNHTGPRPFMSPDAGSESVKPPVRRFVYATVQVEGWHCWPGAPEDCAYLRNPHRHMFHVRAEWPVSHGDRELEIITLKGKLRRLVELIFQPVDEGDLAYSCEDVAEIVLHDLLCSRVEVSEDGENGAVVERKEDK